MIKQATISLTLCISTLFIPQSAYSQNIDALGAGVVKIQNTKLDRQGTGFIVRVDEDGAYIITASHVVSGAEYHDIYLYNRMNTAVKAKVLDKEEDDQKGLALLFMEADKKLLSKLSALGFTASGSLKGGEQIKVLGFPAGQWAVATGNISRLEGRDIVFTAPIEGGYSGSPLLLNDLVIGLVTGMYQPPYAYAIQTESIWSYLNGIKAYPQASGELSPEAEAEEHTKDGNVHWQRASATLGSDWGVFDREMSEALEQYEIAESLQPQNARYRINTGQTLSRLGRYEEAVVKLRKAIDLDPGVAFFHKELCVALHRLKRYEEADQPCLKAVKMDRKNTKFITELEKLLENADKARAQAK